MPERITASPGKVAELVALYETTQQICSRLELDQVLLSIVRRANQLVAGDVAYLAVVDEAQGVLRMRAVDNIRTDAFAQLVMPYGVGLGGTVAAERRPMSTANYLSDGGLDHSGHIDAVVAAEGIQAAVGVPVEFEDRLLAILFVAKRRRARFTAHQVTLLSNLANSAAIALNNAQLYARLSNAMSVHERLMNLALTDQGSTAIAETLSELIDGPVLLLDWAARSLASAGGGITPPTAAELAGTEMVNGCESHTISIAGNVEGYLLVQPQARDRELARVAVQQAVTVFALELAKLRSAEQAETALRGDLLEQLLRRPMADEGALLRTGHRLRVDLAASHAVVIVMPAKSNVGVPPARVSQLARSLRGTTPIVRGDALALLVAAETESEAAGSARALLVACAAAGLPPLVAGIGRSCRQLADYAVSLSEASLAASAATRRTHVDHVVRFDQLAFHQVVLGARPDDMVETARRVLDPLLSYDAAQRGGALMTTLRAYLNRCGNVEATARMLRLHPNTLRGRTARIEELLGRDLQAADTRLDLQLALATLELAEAVDTHQ